jgi:hypothetical protein
MTFAQDVPPENKDYPWSKRDIAPDLMPPTGLGSRIYKG